MLEKFRKMLGVKDLPEEVTPLYRGARNEREALVLLKEARRRDESRRRRAMADLEELDRAEEELLEEGKSDITESRKLMLARRIKEIRWKMERPEPETVAERAVEKKEEVRPVKEKERKTEAPVREKEPPEIMFEE